MFPWDQNDGVGCEINLLAVRGPITLDGKFELEK